MYNDNSTIIIVIIIWPLMKINIGIMMNGRNFGIIGKKRMGLRKMKMSWIYIGKILIRMISVLGWGFCIWMSSIYGFSVWVFWIFRVSLVIFLLRAQMALGVNKKKQVRMETMNLRMVFYSSISFFICFWVAISICRLASRS